MAAIRECGFELLSQPLYSTDLAPSDYHVFRSLKDSLRGQSFGCDEEIIHTINDWFELQDKQFFVDGVNSLAHRWEGRVVLEGDYIEKLKWIWPKSFASLIFSLLINQPSYVCYSSVLHSHQCLRDTVNRLKLERLQSFKAVNYILNPFENKSRADLPKSAYDGGDDILHTHSTNYITK